MEVLADLDELILRCRSEQSKQYLRDAVAAYRANALRSCIVSTWIAVVFDLIDKIRELALSGAGNAKTIHDEFERFQTHLARGDNTVIDSALKFERNILEAARDKLELLDNEQFRDLERLREDRNRCAHPTFHRIEVAYQPAAELARLHLHNAVKHVLSQPPVQGREALEQLKKLVESKYFPFEVDKAKTQFKEGVLGRPSEALVRNFVDYLIYSSIDPNHKLKNDRRALVALQACLDLHRSLTEERASRQLNKIAKSLKDEDAFILIVFSCALDGVWARLEQSTKVTIQEFIKQSSNEQFAKTLKYIFSKTDSLPEIAVRVGALDAVSLATVVERSQEATIRRFILDRAVELYCSVKSWNDANYLAEKVMLPLAPLLNVDQVERIIRAPKEKGADLRGSGGFALFLQRIVQDSVIPQQKLNELLIDNGLENYVPNSADLDDIPF